ncbi:MAG: glycosyltransferase family 2 protein, partial [Alistipes sp.]|nr:glycosyltransferase family 2 protein [Alistipes sp.]
MPRISIIVATYNRAKQLLGTLESLVQQDLPAVEWECVVVDNNSKDDTQKLFSGFVEKHSEFNLRIVREERQGLSFARNRGIEESRGEIIAIIDDDELVNKEFAKSYLELFTKCDNAVVAGGRVVPNYPSGRPSWLSHFTEKPIANPTDWGDNIRKFPKGRIPAGGNMAFRREILLKYGGFDTTLGRVGGKLTGGEESDLFERLANDGVEFWYVPDAIIYHIIAKEKLTTDYFKRLSYNTGVSQRHRAALHNRVIRFLFNEVVKWGVTLVLALYYILTLRPSKG